MDHYSTLHLAAIGGSFLLLSVSIALVARTIVDHWPEIRAAIRGELGGRE